MTAILAILVAMTSIQSGASLAKSLFQVVSPEGLTALRLVFAALILAVVFRPWRHRLSIPQWKTAFLYGAALGGMNLLFYLALRRIPLGVAVAFEFTGPLALALWGSRRPVDLLWVAFAVGGIVLLSPLNASAGLDPLGVLLAVGAGACWALYILFGQRAGKALPGGSAAAFGMIAATVVALPFGIAAEGMNLFNPAILPIALVVAVLSSALPYSLEMIALRKLPMATFSILMSLEPVLAAMSGLLFLDERLTVVQWTAISFIIVASVGSTWSSRKKPV
jgi:inner membrane transporter RhtA